MRRLPLFLAIVVIAVGVAACGGDEEGDTVGSPASAGQTIQVSASDFEFDPPELTASGGSVAFELTNDGDAPHALAIEGNGVDESSDVVDAGETTTLEVTLEDGTYEIYCPVEDHAERGMVGTLTVGGGDGDDGTTSEDTTSSETETGGDDEGETDSGETETGETGTGDSSGSGSDDATNY